MDPEAEEEGNYMDDETGMHPYSPLADAGWYITLSDFSRIQ
jgi:hypothetical protein